MLEHLRQVIGLRGYGQRDPLNEYKAEAYNLFEAMSQNLREQVTGYLMRIQVMEHAAGADAGPALHGGAPPQSGQRRGLRHGRRDAAPALVGNGRRRARRRPQSRPIRRAGARSAATRPAPAAPARSTSTATGGLGKVARFPAVTLSKPRRRKAIDGRRPRATAPASQPCRVRPSCPITAAANSWPAPRLPAPRRASRIARDANRRKGRHRGLPCIRA